VLCVQAGTSRDDVASEAVKCRSKCAELEAAAAKVKVLAPPQVELALRRESAQNRECTSGWSYSARLMPIVPQDSDKTFTPLQHHLKPYVSAIKLCSVQTGRAMSDWLLALQPAELCACMLKLILIFGLSARHLICLHRSPLPFTLPISAICLPWQAKASLSACGLMCLSPPNRLH